LVLIYDISMLIEHEMPVYKNLAEKRPTLNVVRNHGSGKIHESRLEMDLHCGTHIDAPLHVIAGGSTLESIDLSKFIRGCKVLDLTAVKERITQDELKEKAIDSGDFILLKTRNSLSNSFDLSFVYLAKSGAEYLTEKGVVGVGIDSLGIERNQPDYDTHKTLLSAGIVIMEGLRLAHVVEGKYTLIALPLKIKGAEASPVRAILIQPNESDIM